MICVIVSCLAHSLTVLIWAVHVKGTFSEGMDEFENSFISNCSAFKLGFNCLRQIFTASKVDCRDSNACELQNRLHKNGRKHLTTLCRDQK